METATSCTKSAACLRHIVDGFDSAQSSVPYIAIHRPRLPVPITATSTTVSSSIATATASKVVGALRLSATLDADTCRLTVAGGVLPELATLHPTSPLTKQRSCALPPVSMLMAPHRTLGPADHHHRAHRFLPLRGRPPLLTPPTQLGSECQSHEYNGNGSNSPPLRWSPTHASLAYRITTHSPATRYTTPPFSSPTIYQPPPQHILDTLPYTYTSTLLRNASTGNDLAPLKSLSSTAGCLAYSPTLSDNYNNSNHNSNHNHNHSHDDDDVGGGYESAAIIDTPRMREHICPECGRAFQRAEHVRRHRLTHTNERPYICPYAQCGRAFGRSDNLKAHMRSHQRKRVHRSAFYRSMHAYLYHQPALGDYPPTADVTSESTTPTWKATSPESHHQYYQYYYNDAVESMVPELPAPVLSSSDNNAAKLPDSTVPAPTASSSSSSYDSTSSSSPGCSPTWSPPETHLRSPYNSASPTDSDTADPLPPPANGATLRALSSS